MRQFIAFLLLFLTATSFAQELQENMWVTNGDVYAVQRAGNTVYIGGAFSQVGPNVPYGAAISTGTGNPGLSYAKPNNSVRVAVPDGAGGWYIGGSFTSVNGQPRTGLARINADGSLNSWNPALGITPPTILTVYTIAIDGGTIYIGGNFNTIGGQTRNYIGAVDAITGAVTSWNPIVNNLVRTLAVGAGKIYVGGNFTNVGGDVGRSYMVAFDAGGAVITSWNAYAGDYVSTIIVAGSTLYVSGNFTSIGGQSRGRIAALDANSGTAITGWNPNANDVVNTLAMSGDGNTVYVGGAFTTIGGQSRNRIAALNMSNGTLTDWNPNADGPLYTLAVAGGTVYAGGGFTNIGGQPRNYIAALNTGNNNATSWNPNVNNLVLALAVAGSTVYAGGSFTMIGAVNRRNLAAFDATTGAPTSWNPAPGGASTPVYALAVGGGAIYVGGEFTTMDGQPRNFIAAFDETSGALKPSWNPSSNHRVLALAATGGRVYAGGLFTNIGGATRSCIAALDATTGNAITDWNPNANGSLSTNAVGTLAVAGNIVYAGGNFKNIGGQPRDYIAALDATTGNATEWNPGASTTVYAIAVSGSMVYVGGAFTTFDGQPRNRIAAVGADGTHSSWNPNAVDGTVNALAVANGKVYAGGGFFTIGGQARSYLAALDATTGNATEWNPNASSSVQALAAAGGALYVGGQFTQIEGQSRPRFAAFSVSDGLPVTFGLIEAYIKDGQLFVNWTSLTETNNHHYEVEVSADGVHFQKIGEAVLSKAKDGNADIPLSYSFSYPSGAGLLSVSMVSFIAMALLGKRRRVGQFMVFAVLTIGYISCSKTAYEGIDASNKKVYIRIAQMDKDGTKTYSKTVQVVKE